MLPFETKFTTRNAYLLVGDTPRDHFMYLNHCEIVNNNGFTYVKVFFLIWLGKQRDSTNCLKFR